MLYPVMLDLRGRPVVVVGAGAVAARKIAALVEAGAVVTVVAPDVGDAARAAGASMVVERPYERGDLDGALFAVAATGDPTVNAAVADDAERAGIFVNAADDPQHCSALLPAVLRRGPVVVSVSTSGSAPAFASWLRDRIADAVDERAGAVAAELLSRRQAIHRRGGSTETVDWRAQIEQLWSAGAPLDAARSAEPPTG